MTSMQGDETGIVQGDKTGMVQSPQTIFGVLSSAHPSVLVERTGLHTIPSYSTSILSEMHNVAGSRTWSDIFLFLVYRMILGSGAGSGAGIVVMWC